MAKLEEAVKQAKFPNELIKANLNVTLTIKKLLNKYFITVEQSEMDKSEYKINITKSGVAF